MLLPMSTNNHKNNVLLLLLKAAGAVEADRKLFRRFVLVGNFPYKFPEISGLTTLVSIYIMSTVKMVAY